MVIAYHHINGKKHMTKLPDIDAGRRFLNGRFKQKVRCEIYSENKKIGKTWKDHGEWFFSFQ